MIMHSKVKCVNKYISFWFWPDRLWVPVGELLVILADFDMRVGRVLVDLVILRMN